MKTREIPLDDGFKPYPNGIHPKLAERQAAQEKKTAESPRNPFEELESDKYRKPTNPFYSKPAEEMPILNLADQPTQKAAQKVEEPEEIEEEAEFTETTEALIARSSSNLSPDWIRQDLLSYCIPYSFNDVHLRTLPLRSLGLIHASHIKQSFTLLLDALNHCVSVDIRDLTPPDLTYVMHWIRDNSYPKSPMKIKYTTRYGNKIDVSVRGTELKFQVLEMTAEEYKEWQDKGLCFPTVRDMELLFGDSVPLEQRYLLDYAQYVYADIPEDQYDNYAELKIQALEKLGFDIFPEIDRFSERINHGIDETFTITDPKFVPIQAAEYFEARAKELFYSISMISEDESEDLATTIIEIGATAEAMVKEAKEIRDALGRGEKVLPKEEVVAVKITAMDFFPPKG